MFQHLFLCWARGPASCVRDQIENLRAFDPASEILVFGPEDSSFPLIERELRLLGAVLLPAAEVPDSFSQVVLRTRAFVERRFRPDATTVLDAGSLLLRTGYSRALAEYFQKQPASSGEPSAGAVLDRAGRVYRPNFQEYFHHDLPLSEPASERASLRSLTAPPGAPLISCIMPTGDRPQMIRSAVEAVLAQDYEDFELIIVDDGAAPSEALLPRSSAIQYVRLSRGASIGKKRNLACTLARGEWIAHFDDDDWSAPWRLRSQLALVRAHGAVLAACSSILYENIETGEAWRLSLGNEPSGPLFYRRTLWSAHPFLDVDVGEDEVLLRAAKIHGIASDAGEYFLARIHSGNISPKFTAGPAWQKLDAALGETLRKGSNRHAERSFYPARVSVPG